MVLGMSIAAFTALHVILSLIGILAGAVVVFQMWNAKTPQGWTAVFLATTVATSVTGFMFPSEQFTPARVVGLISLVALAAALFGLYYARLAGAWRWIYVSGAVMALYLNVFVAVVQAFQKLAFLHPLAPTGSEPPFVVTQVFVLAAFIWVAVLALRRFHPSVRSPMAAA
jgi:hypothetical protein